MRKRGQDSNLRSPAYEAGELPLLYPAIDWWERPYLGLRSSVHCATQPCCNQRGPFHSDGQAKLHG